MSRACTNCKQLDALNTDLTNLMKALIRGEADERHPLLKEWLQKRDIAWFNHFCDELSKHVVPDEPITLQSLKLAFAAIHLHPEHLKVVSLNPADTLEINYEA